MSEALLTLVLGLLVLTAWALYMWCLQLQARIAELEWSVGHLEMDLFRRTVEALEPTEKPE